jgi:hypothetical protein
VVLSPDEATVEGGNLGVIRGCTEIERDTLNSNEVYGMSGIGASGGDGEFRLSFSAS